MFIAKDPNRLKNISDILVAFVIIEAIWLVEADADIVLAVAKMKSRITRHTD